MPCDRGITRSILEKLIESKVQHLFKTGDVRLARLFNCMRQWWLRGTSDTHTQDECLKDFQNDIMWKDDMDGTKKSTHWVDRFGVSILFYAVLANKAQVVKDILALFDEYDRTRLLAWKISRKGAVEVGDPGYSTCLMGAMSFASPSIVIELLRNGADTHDTDVIGNDAVMLACTLNRLDTIETWFEKNPDWNVDRQNTTFGSTALHLAVYVGSRSLELTRFLIEKQNANVNIANKSGTSTLILACGNVDSDPKLVRYLLEERQIDVNRQIKSQTMKWKMLRAAARLVLRSKVFNSKLLRRVAESSGLTALHYAVRRGDIEIVELLMKYNANPFLKNDLGRDVISYCEPFPEIKGAIERVQRETRQAQREKSITTTRETRPAGAVASTKGTKDFTLQRRLSTATNVKYDMYLMSLTKVMKLFGSSTDRNKNFNLCHQNLLESGDLTRFEDLPMGTFTMFISHEWLSRDRLDPTGVQLSTLCHVIRELQDGKIDCVSMDVIHRLTYKHNFSTSAKEWVELLTNAYVWFDWWSQPQPSMEKVGTPEQAKCVNDLAQALRSTAAYVMFGMAKPEYSYSFFFPFFLWINLSILNILFNVHTHLLIFKI